MMAIPVGKRLAPMVFEVMRPSYFGNRDGTGAMAAAATISGLVTGPVDQLTVAGSGEE
jgi:hypothetical protein